MAWNPKSELVKKAAEIAKKKHPKGFNKSQLIAASKEVYGGFAANPSKPIKTLEDVSHAGNAMANIDGHYPTGMSGCYVVGINGGCGYDCPVFRAGQCDEHEHGMLMGLLNGEGYENHGSSDCEHEIREIFQQVYGGLDEFIEDHDIDPSAIKFGA